MGSNLFRALISTAIATIACIGSSASLAETSQRTPLLLLRLERDVVKDGSTVARYEKSKSGCPLR